MNKLIISSLSILLIPFFLFSCIEKSYRDDLSCEYISNELSKKSELTGEYDSYNRENIDFLFGKSLLYDDFSVIYSVDVNDINELGIFHCPDEKKTNEFLDVVNKYVADMKENQKAFISSYAPQEIPKLESSEVRKYGNYVIYLILDSNAKEKAFEQAKDILEK